MKSSTKDKRMYPQPYKARYSYSVRDRFGGFVRHTVGVKVWGETRALYYVALNMEIPGHREGDCLWVRKRNVEFPRAAEPDYTGLWFNNFESRELPLGFERG